MGLYQRYHDLNVPRRGADLKDFTGRLAAPVDSGPTYRSAGLVLLLKYNLQVARLELAVVPLEGESINQLCYTCFLLFNTRAA